MQALIEDWNELQLVRAIARAEGLVAATRMLGIDHSTAFRRLRTIEKRLGHQLFERAQGGTYWPTPFGERMTAAAERMEDEVLALARDIAGRDHRLTGRLRAACSETLAYRQLTPHLAAFRDAHPGIVVELTIDNRVLNLTRREADAALRPVRPKEGDLWGRKLADVAWAMYGAHSYLKRHGLAKRARDLGSHKLIGWDETAAGIKAAEWLATIAPASGVAYRTNSLVNQLNAVKAEMGLAALPCYLGDPEPELLRALPDPIAELAGELWIVTHVDLRRTARVQAFFELVGGGLAAQRGLFEGRTPTRPAAADATRKSDRKRRR
jgi:DNA-binding transcriptional LysR family regulator